MSHRYLAYNLTIDSDLPLPELLPSDAAPDVPPDVNVRFGPVDRGHAPAPNVRGACAYMNADEACLRFDDAATYLVRGGRHITIDPTPGTEPRVQRLFLLGPSLAVLLHQRGLLVLHASAVSVNGHAVAFLGDKGMGKSTTAAAFHDAGHPLIADDLVPVDLSDEVATVAPGFPQLKLCPDAAARFFDSPDSLPHVHPSHDKRAAAAWGDFSRQPLPLKRLCVLADDDIVSVTPLRPHEAIPEIVRHSYMSELLDLTGEMPLHFRQATSLLAKVPARRLARPRDLSQISGLVRMVEHDVMR